MVAMALPRVFSVLLCADVVSCTLHTIGLMVENLNDSHQIQIIKPH